MVSAEALFDKALEVEEKIAEFAEELYNLLNEMYERVMEVVNAGQAQLLDMVFEQWMDLMEVWAEEWPWVDSDEFSAAAYDTHWAVEQCLSDTIDSTAEQVNDIVDKAQREGTILEFLEALLGGF